LIEATLQNDMLSFNNSKTKVVYGLGEAVNIRKHIEIMIQELQEYFYIGDEIFLLVTKSVTETEFYKKFIEKLGSSEIVICDYQDPGLLELAEVFSLYRKNRQRIVVGLGGGSIMDLAKAVSGWAYHPRFIPAFPITSEGLPCYPLLLIPTLAGSGSEVSPYIIMTDKQGCKVTTGLIPSYLSIIDPSATVTAPPCETLYAALIAFTHSVEAFISSDSTEETDRFAFRAIELIIYYLSRVLQNKDDGESRSYLSLASVLSGFARKAGLGLTTAIGQQIHNLPYGLVMALLLPFIIKFNSHLCREKYDKINSLFVYRSENLEDTIQNWFTYLGVYCFEVTYRKNLETFLESEYCIRLATQLVLENMHYNTSPGKPDPEEIKKLIFSLYTIPLQYRSRDTYELF